MYTHQPDNYVCPFCEWLAGKETEYKHNTDIVYQDEFVTAFVSPKWWINNPGNVIIIPNAHYENIYTLPDDLLTKVSLLSKRLAIAMRQSYGCTGISTRQHNEPDGNQDVWHFHTHLFPRHPNDLLYQNHENKHFAEPEARKSYAETLKQQLLSLK